jgi:hypothetical protein
MQLVQIDTNTIKVVAFATLVAVALAGCTPDAEERNLQVIRDRGEQFLSLLRSQQWHESTEMVLLNDAAYNRFNFPNQRDPAALKNEIANLFKRAYSNVKPGALVSVRINPGDPTLASITYRHGDLDSFNMSLSNGQWYYNFQ